MFIKALSVKPGLGTITYFIWFPYFYLISTFFLFQIISITENILVNKNNTDPK